MENLPMISALVGVAGVVFAAILAGVVKGAPAGNEKMREIADAISEGAIAYLNRQLITMSMTGIVIFVIIWLSIDLKTGVGFLVGQWHPSLRGTLECGFRYWPMSEPLKLQDKDLPQDFPWHSKAGQ